MTSLNTKKRPYKCNRYRVFFYDVLNVRLENICIWSFLQNDHL